MKLQIFTAGDGREKRYFLVRGELKENVISLKERHVRVEPAERTLIIRTCLYYLVFFLGILSAFSGGGEKTGKTPSEKLSQAPSAGRVNDPKISAEDGVMSLDKIERLLSSGRPSDADLRRAYLSMRVLEKRCGGECPERERILRLSGALELKLEERFRELRFEAEKRIRMKDPLGAERLLRRIIFLIPDPSDERYGYATRRLRELRRER